MVDIVHSSLGVDKLDQVLYDLDDVSVGEHPYIVIYGKVQLLVQTVSSYISEVVPLFREEQLVYHIPCSRLIRRFGITQLFVDVVDGFCFRICRVFLEGVVDDRILIHVSLLFLEENGLHICFRKPLYGVFIQYLASFDDRHGPFHRDHFARILIHEILYPCLQDLRGKFPAFICLEVFRSGFYFVSQSEYVYDILVSIEADGTEQSSYRQFLFPVDVRVHHVVDVRGELYP